MAEAPYDIDPTADGYFAIICNGEAHGRSLTRPMDRADLADDPRFATPKERVVNVDRIDEIVTGWTQAVFNEALFRAMIAAHVPSAPVRSLDEVMRDPNMHARRALEMIDHPEFGRIIVQQAPLRFAGQELPEITPSRPLGADTEAVLAAPTAGMSR